MGRRATDEAVGTEVRLALATCTGILVCACNGSGLTVAVDSAMGPSDLSCQMQPCGVDGATDLLDRCSDRSIDGDETDIDCGGRVCSGCGVARGCVADDDCLSGRCSGRTCVACELSFSRTHDYPLPAFWPFGITTADMDGDGHADLIAMANGYQIATFLGDGSGGLGVAFPYSLDRQLFGGFPWLGSGDFAGDGLNEVAVASGVRVVFARFLRGPGWVTITEELFEAATYGSVVGQLRQGAPADVVGLDRDGAVSVSANTGGWQFGPPQSFRTGFGGVGRPWVGDVDGDGDADILVHSASGRVVALLNQAGAFVAGTPLLAGEAFDGIEPMGAADLDGDGLPELVILGPDGARANCLVRVLKNQGGGAWGSASLAGTLADSCPDHMVLRDLDSDGVADLALVGSTTKVLEVRLGKKGSFAAPMVVDASPGAVGVTAADLDGDGLLDLATANVRQGVGVLINTCR